MRNLLLASMLFSVPLSADWIYEDDDGQRFIMKDPAPNPYPKDEDDSHLACEEPDIGMPFPFPLPQIPDEGPVAYVVLFWPTSVSNPCINKETV